jgi:hypothetical protein
MRKDGELFVRGIFDLGVRRKPQAFAADAVDLWILNHNMLIINWLKAYNQCRDGELIRPDTAVSMAQCRVRGACGFVLTGKPEVTRKMKFCLDCRISVGDQPPETARERRTEHLSESYFLCFRHKGRWR